MKNFSEKLKDILYASIDYVIMLGIIATVVLIIGWRLDILFQKDALASMTGHEIKIENPIDKKKDELKEEPKHEEENIDTNEELHENEINTPTEEVEKAPEIEEVNVAVKNIEVKIPDGSFPAQIGSILQSSGLVESSTEFIKKAVDLNLDTKLKSGTFLIPENSSLEKIVNIIAKQRT